MLEVFEAVVREGVVEAWGFQSDMPAVFARSHVVCLPSVYSEGVPKVLIEAACSGLPVVATDRPGCREIVRDGENGRLVPAGDPARLADALIALVDDGEARRTMGMRGRRIVEEEFSLARVIDETLAVYGKFTADSVRRVEARRGEAPE